MIHLVAARRAPAPGARALYYHRIFFRFAAAAGNVFAWIFIFRAFYDANHSTSLSIAGVAILYALAQVIALILTPVAGIWLRSGVRRALLYGTAACALSFILLSFMFMGLERDVAFWAISMFVLFHGLQRALYWIPYRTAQADLRAEKNAFIYAREAAIALVPFFMGLIIGVDGNAAVIIFVIAGGFALLSILPLALIPEMHERYIWSYRETWSKLVAYSNHPKLAVSVLNGMQACALFLVWPLCAFLILNWSYAVFGFVMSATLLGTLLLRKPLDLLASYLPSRISKKVTAAFVLSAWLFKLSAATALQIVVVDTYYLSGSSPKRFHIDPFAFDQSADSGHFVDEETALKEMGLALGRAFMALIFGALALVFVDIVALVAAVVLAAIVSALAVLLTHQSARRVV